MAYLPPPALQGPAPGVRRLPDPHRRAQLPHYWVRQAAWCIHGAYYTLRPPLFVITDVRFADEAALVRQLHGQIWQIKRPGCDVDAGAHASEVTGEAFAPDVVINNNHDIAHLQQLVLSSYYVTKTSEVHA